MQKLLNKKVAESAKPQAKPYQIADTAIPGFVLRVQPSGAKIWKLRYTRLDGTRTVRTLGRMPVMTFEMAKEKVTAILQGNDPDEQPEPTPEPPPVLTLGVYLTKHYKPYLDQHHSRPNESLSYLQAFKLDDKPLDDVRQADVEAWRLKRLKAGRARATINRQISALKAAFQRAVEWDLLPDNPLKRLKPLKNRQARCSSLPIRR